MKRGDQKKVLELFSSSIFMYALWIGFGFFMVIILDLLFWLNTTYQIRDFIHIFSILLSVFLVFILYTILYFVYASFKIFFKKELNE